MVGSPKDVCLGNLIDDVSNLGTWPMSWVVYILAEKGVLHMMCHLTLLAQVASVHPVPSVH